MFGLLGSKEVYITNLSIYEHSGFWLSLRSMAVLVGRAKYNKGGRGQRNREETGAGATWKTACTDGGHFWVGPYVSVRIVPIGSECSPVNQIF